MIQRNCPTTSCLGIDRVYQPQTEALAAVVDLLFLLLMNGPESLSPSSEDPELTCFPVEPVMEAGAQQSPKVT